MKPKIIYISLFLAFTLIAMGTVWLFFLPVVVSGYGKNATIKHASDKVWIKWHQLSGLNQELTHEIESQREDIISAQQRSIALKNALEDPQHQHEDVTLVKESNLAFIDRTYTDLSSHAAVSKMADVLSDNVLKVKTQMEGARLRNLLIVPEGVNTRFNALEEHLLTAATEQQSLMIMDNKLLESLQSNLSIFAKQVDQVVNNSAYFKGIKDCFMVQQIQKTMEENIQLQTKITIKQQKIVLMNQRHQEQVQALEKSIKEYREYCETHMAEQRDRMRENNELLKERMRDQRERLIDSRERANESQSKLHDMQESLKDKLRK